MTLTAVGQDMPERAQVLLDSHDDLSSMSSLAVNLHRLLKTDRMRHAQRLASFPTC